MAPQNFRNAFLENLQELTSLLLEGAIDDRVVWSVEYSCRNGTVYRFDGISEQKSIAASGNALAAGNGSPQRVDSVLLPLVMLDFNENVAIRAYSGEQQLPSRIALDVMGRSNSIPEVVRVDIDRKYASECGRLITTSTHFAYLGFLSLRDLGESVGSSFTASANQLSTMWFRGRTTISALPLGARDQAQDCFRARP